MIGRSRTAMRLGMIRSLVLCSPLAALTHPVGVAAHEEELLLEEVIVTGRRQVLAGEARSASEGVIGAMDLALRPLLRPGDLLEAIPGLIVTQHSGSGKSNQMFLRGFNLDHGTDFATWVDGMPVNMRTHGHGQGYTDINFLIPETVERIEFVKGPYHAELGDFSSAGGSRIYTSDQPGRQQVKLGLGENGYARLLAMGGAEPGALKLSYALEGQVYDGPWTDIEEDVEKVSGLLKIGSQDELRRWNVTAMVYDNQWNSADQIPTRAVHQGLIDELGSLDTSLGGESHRYSLSGNLSHEHGSHRSEWNAYLIDYRMQLWSNFTYLLEDPLQGDQFEQLDERRIWGGSWNRFWVSGAREHFHHRFGLEFRYDDIEQIGLYQTRGRQRLDTVREDAVDETSASMFYELAWHIDDNWRAVLGLRGDYYWFDVDADIAVNSGDDEDSIVSPRGSLIYAFSEVTEAYFSAGYGFHSNDARGTTIRVDPSSLEPAQQVDALVESRGAEVGMKTVLLDSLNSSLALWYLELDSELLFVGDGGTTEASRPSRRYGVEFNNFWAINEIWSLEADFAWTDAAFEGNEAGGDHIPGALRSVVTGSLSAAYPSGWFGSLRLRYFDDYPLEESGRVRADDSLITNLALGWGGERWRAQLDLLNVFDSDDHDVDYFYASRLNGEPAGGIEDIHYHVFEPRQVRLYASIDF
jgi:outer membrane receptor protein involved in Fe transport